MHTSIILLVLIQEQLGFLLSRELFNMRSIEHLLTGISSTISCVKFYMKLKYNINKMTFKVGYSTQYRAPPHLVLVPCTAA